MVFSDINWWAVMVAASSAFVVGGLWYGPLFGQLWQTLVGLTDEQAAEANMAMIFGSAFALTIVESMILALIIPASAGWTAGAGIGLVVALAFVAPAFGINYLFARKPRALFAIDAGYVIAQFALLGAIIGAWP